VIRALALMLALMPAPALAQSAFGCTGVDVDHDFASLEGAGGAFFRLDPDLKMWHPMEDATVARLGRLSQALAAGGTTLVYVHLPVRSLAMPERLPLAAQDYGFDPVMAATVHDLDEARLRDAGVVVPQTRSALRKGAAGSPSFHLADPGLTTDGADRLAAAIAAAIAPLPALAALPRAQFATAPAADPGPPVSRMRAALQRHCLSDLPLPMVAASTTTRLQGGLASDAALLGATTVAPRIAIVGTEQIGAPALNLSGRVAQATGFETLIYTVDGGGAFGAIASYMTSRAFQETRPAVLVWVNPVENSLATHGDQPLAELTAAAGSGCTVPLQVLGGAAPGTASADLSPVAGGGAWTLLFDAEGTPATEARFDFLDASGLPRSFWVTRAPGALPSGRFYMPLAALGAKPATRVDVTLNAPFVGPVRMAACNA
jgi:alginate biosynthesis protein AlgX